MFAAIEQMAISEQFTVSAIYLRTTALSLFPPYSVGGFGCLSVSRSGFYSWQFRGLSARDERDTELMPTILDIFWRHRRRYGARRIAMDLADMGETCGVARVAKLLEKQGLRAIQPKSHRPRTTNSRHRLGDNSNLLKDRSMPSRINEVWVGDITDIPLRGGRFGYLSVLMDLYSRRIVGWEYQNSMTDALVLASLRKAIRDRQPAAELIHHSDRGGGHRREAVVARRRNIGTFCVGPGCVRA